MHTSRVPGISITNIPPHYYYLGETMFVLFKEENNEIKIYIQNFTEKNGLWYPTKWYVSITPDIWYLICMNMDANYNFYIPNSLLVYWNNHNRCYLQRMWIRYKKELNYEYHAFLPEKCYMNERQWQVLKDLRGDISDNIILYTFGEVLTRLLKTKTLEQTATINDLAQIILRHMIKCLPKTGIKSENFQNNFYFAVLKLDIKIIAKDFYTTYNSCLDTIGSVKQLFEIVYQLFIV